MKKDIAVIARFYGMSKESEAMAYKSATHSNRARMIYSRIRESIERDEK
jgi:hypothetical protein